METELEAIGLTPLEQALVGYVSDGTVLSAAASLCGFKYYDAQAVIQRPEVQAILKARYTAKVESDRMTVRNAASKGIEVVSQILTSEDVPLLDKQKAAFQMMDRDPASVAVSKSKTENTTVRMTFNEREIEDSAIAVLRDMGREVIDVTPVEVVPVKLSHGQRKAANKGRRERERQAFAAEFEADVEKNYRGPLEAAQEQGEEG